MKRTLNTKLTQSDYLDWTSIAIALLYTVYCVACGMWVGTGAFRASKELPHVIFSQCAAALVEKVEMQRDFLKYQTPWDQKPLESEKTVEEEKEEQNK